MISDIIVFHKFPESSDVLNQAQNFISMKTAKIISFQNIQNIYNSNTSYCLYEASFRMVKQKDDFVAKL